MSGGQDPLDLFAHLFGEQSGWIGGFSGLRPAPGDKRLEAVRSAYFPFPDDRLRASGWFRDEAAVGREAYFCSHLLSARQRLKANAAPILALWADGDGAKVPGRLPSPTAVVGSSPSREQFYWRLSRPVPPREGEQLNRRLAQAMGADRSGWDLTQLLRPPGTLNHKYPGTPPVVLRGIREAAYEPAKLDRLLPPLPKEEPRMMKPRRPEELGPTPDLSRLSRRMEDLVRRGNRGEEYESRSEADMAACVAMFGAGYSEAEVWATMTDPTNGISEKFLEKGRHGERYLSLTIGKAKARAEVTPRRRRPSRSGACRVHKGATRG